MYPVKVHLGGSKLTCPTFWTKVHWTSFAERKTNRSLSQVFLIWDILTRSEDIRDQSRKLCKIDSNFARFWPQIFLEEGPKFLDLCYKIQPHTDHMANFHDDDWLRELRDPVAKSKLK